MTAIVAPLLCMVALELCLRVAGYGYPTSFLLPSTVEGRDFMIPNEEFSHRFFPPDLARTPALFRMPVPKPEGTYRIFLFGESAAYGDPDPTYGMGRYLEALLEERYPSLSVEVVCAAMTAINSHAILPIVRECARYEGDLWVVYMGNNEMVGPYGAGTIFGAKAPGLGMVRTTLALKETRVGQWMDDVLRSRQRVTSTPRTWGGIDMFSRSQLRHDDAGRLRAYANFEANLGAILEAGNKAGVPIVLSTVCSNLRDCAPFASLHAEELDDAQRAEWQKWYQDGLLLERDGSYQAALDAYAKAAAIDPGFAELLFRTATCHLRLGQTAEARRAFERARDHDALAVRADTRINQIIMQVPGEDDDANVVRVDAAARLAESSPDGIPGQDLFYEHVHFTLEGNYRLARILAHHVADLLPDRIASQGADRWAESAACDRRLAVTLWDRQRLWREMLQRTSGRPYTSQSSHRVNLEQRGHRLRDVLERIGPDAPELDDQLYRNALERAPEDNMLHANYAQFLEATGSRLDAIAQGQKVRELLPDLSWPHYYVGALLVQEGRNSEAAVCFERALEIRSGMVQARHDLRRIRSGSR